MKTRIYQSESGCRTSRVRAQDIESQIKAGGPLAGEAEALRAWRESVEIPAGARLIRRNAKTGEDCYEWSERAMVAAAATILGAKGGRQSSPAKSAANRANAMQRWHPNK